VTAGRQEAAVEILMRAAEEERSPRGSFLRRAQAAAILVDAGLERVALPILEQLAEEIQAHTLEDWEEAETIAHPLGLLYRCIFAMEGQSSEAQRLFVRVCRLDPMQAMRYGPAPE
jgi:type VI secretion system protein ImpA